MMKSVAWATTQKEDVFAILETPIINRCSELIVRWRELLHLNEERKLTDRIS